MNLRKEEGITLGNKSGYKNIGANTAEEILYF